MKKHSYLYRFAIALIATLALGSLSFAQAPAEKVVPPEGPILQKAPEFSRWTVDFTYSGALDKPTKSIAAYQNSRTKKYTVVKTREIVSEELIDSTGHRLERWHSGLTEYTRQTGQNGWFELIANAGGGAVNADLSPLPPSGFRDVEVVTAANYTGVVQYGNISCLVFVPGGAAKVNLKDPKQVADLDKQYSVAYVDAKTRLPVALKIGNELRKFTFAPPPTEMQSLPADLVATIKRGAEGRAALAQPAARPY